MLGKQIQQFRKQKGLSQEALAERSGLSVRTIQRIEAGVSKPRVFTLKVLAEALEVSIAELETTEPFAATSLKDYRFVKLMNLSILSNLVIPLANIVCPLLIWRKQKADKFAKELGAKLISFQIWWTLMSILIFIFTPMVSLALTGQAQVGQFPVAMALYFLLVFVNIGLSLYIASDPQNRATRIYHRVPALF